MQYSHLYAHIIEDDLAFAQALKGLLPGEFKITLSRKIEEARKNFLSQKHSLVFLDLCIEEAWDGFELLREIKEKNHLTTIIVITSSLDQKIHEKALELGASFVLSKNINHDLFDKILMNLLFKFKSKSEVIKENEHGSRFFFGNNKKLKTIESNLEKYSKTNLSILIEGETGTGKELLAKELSKNCKNFITIDCSTISNEISDSILFGHEKGSFTGAHERKIGLLEEANKGVIFFDEISNLSLDVQKKLLRVLQEKEVRSVGGNVLKKVEFKIISASNVSIKKLIDEKKFLKDLYYRIAQIEITLPSLNERIDEIECLVEFLIKKNKINRKIHEIEKSFLNSLKKHSWIGNIRELENILLATELFWSESKSWTNHHLSLRSESLFDDTNNYFESVENLEKDYLKKILKLNSWNVIEICKKYKISKSQIYNKMNKFKIQSEV